MRQESTAVPPCPTGEDALVRAHLPLVHYAVAEVANRVPRHVSRDDLTSAGMAGLAQAARSFDPERAVSFGRFAATRIRGAILDELRSRDWASRSVRAKARHLANVSDRLTAELGRAPTQAELAGELGVEPGDVDAINRDVARSAVLNLDGLSPDGGAEDGIVADEAGPESVILERERQAYLVAAVANLPERLKRVVMGYFFEEMPMHTLASELGVTDSRISQMRSEALLLLRAAIDAQLEPGSAGGTDTSRAGRRRAAYVEAVSTHHDYRERFGVHAASLASLARPVSPA